MVQYDFYKVYVREIKQDVFVKKKHQMPPIWPIQRWPRSQRQVF